MKIIMDFMIFPNYLVCLIPFIHSDAMQQARYSAIQIHNHRVGDHYNTLFAKGMQLYQAEGQILNRLNKLTKYASATVYFIRAVKAFKI